MKTLLNIICNKKVRYSILLMFLFLIYTLVCAISYVEAVSQDLSDSVLRLHVIANSDSVEDQNLKYMVRDNVLAYMNELCLNVSSKEEAIAIATSHLEDFKQIAFDTITANGFDYPVSVEIGNFDFPTKTYGDISLPSGFYDALRIKIGEASGQNWWCVMFPPLCFVDVSSGIVPDASKDQMKSNLSDEEFSLISSEDMDFKFKLVEFFQNLNILTAKK